MLRYAHDALHCSAMHFRMVGAVMEWVQRTSSAHVSCAFSQNLPIAMQANMNAYVGAIFGSNPPPPMVDQCRPSKVSVIDSDWPQATRIVRRLADTLVVPLRRVYINNTMQRSESNDLDDAVIIATFSHSELAVKVQAISDSDIQGLATDLLRVHALARGSQALLSSAMATHMTTWQLARDSVLSEANVRLMAHCLQHFRDVLYNAPSPPNVSSWALPAVQPGWPLNGLHHRSLCCCPGSRNTPACGLHHRSH